MALCRMKIRRRAIFFAASETATEPLSKEEGSPRHPEVFFQQRTGNSPTVPTKEEGGKEEGARKKETSPLAREKQGS